MVGKKKEREKEEKPRKEEEKKNSLLPFCFLWLACFGCCCCMLLCLARFLCGSALPCPHALARPLPFLCPAFSVLPHVLACYIMCASRVFFCCLLSLPCGRTLSIALSVSQHVPLAVFSIPLPTSSFSPISSLVLYWPQSTSMEKMPAINASDDGRMERRRSEAWGSGQA